MVQSKMVLMWTVLGNNLTLICRMLLLVCFSFAGAFGSDQQMENLGFGYGFRYRPDWTVTRDGDSWELKHASMPSIALQWMQAGSSRHASSHQITVNNFTANYFKRYRLALRDYGTRPTDGANGEIIYETELGTEVNGNLIRLHYQTLLLGGRLLSVVGCRENDKSSVTYAREIASSVERVQAGSQTSRSGQPIVGRWSAPGAPDSAVVIFRADGTFESDEPIAGWRRGRYTVDGSRVTLTWNGSHKQETWGFRISGQTLAVTRPAGRVTYTRDGF